jgi:hypothetical protein
LIRDARAREAYQGTYQGARTRFRGPDSAGDKWSRASKRGLAVTTKFRRPSISKYLSISLAIRFNLHQTAYHTNVHTMGDEIIF